jgi:hypothetical protein
MIPIATVRTAPAPVNPSSATKLGLTTQPSSTATNAVVFATQPVIQIQDASGNPISQLGTVVTASIASGGGTLGGTLTATTNSSGVATFTGLKITGTAGARTLAFAASGLTGVTSGTVTTSAGAASQLGITTQPSTTATNATAFATQPVIQLQDVSGNSVLTSGVTVTASIASGGGTLGGTTTANTNSSGVATFSGLAITGTIGGRTLTFAVAGLTSATSGTITVSAGSASKLAITTQPSSSASTGVAFSQQPVIQLQDVSSNNVSQSSVTVTAAIGTGSDTLGGTLTATTNSSGVATFTNLKLTGTGSDTLTFSATSLTSVTSSTIALGSATPLWRDDFSSYANTAAYVTAALSGTGIHDGSETQGTSNMTIDTTVHDTGYTQSLRYFYPNATSIGGSGKTGRCTTSVNTSSSYNGGFNGSQGPWWYRYRFKTSTNFLTAAPTAWGCTSGEGLKFLDLAVTPGDRFSVGLLTGLTPATTGQIWFGYPDNNTDPQGMVNFGGVGGCGNLVDGNWHEVKGYVKNSTGYPGAAHADGAIRGYIDGVKYVDESALTVTSTAGTGVPPSSFYTVQLGRNLNQGPAQDQYLYWQFIEVYNTDPGW